MTVRSWRVWLLLLIMSGCAGDGGADVTSDGPPVATETIEQLASRIGCGPTEPLSEFDAPIRGRAATRGLSCTARDVAVHLFQRAPLGDGDATNKAPAFAMGGSLENIDRLVGGGIVGPPECMSWVVVGETWFLLADDDAAVERFADELNGVLRAPQPASPQFSYVAPGC